MFIRVFATIWLVFSALSLSAVLHAEVVASKAPAAPHIFVDSNVYLSTFLQQQIQAQSQPQSFYLVSHGRPGELFIDGEWLNAKQIKAFLDQKLKAGDALRVLIYGCSFGKGEVGLDAVAYLQIHLRLPVYASDDTTGHSGDWELELGRSVMSDLQIKDYPYNL